MSSFQDESANLYQRRSNKKRNVIISVSLLAVVALTIGLSVGLTRPKGDSNQESVSTNQEPVAISTKTSFSRSSSFIDTICSIENNSTVVNEACEVECQEAQCCDPFDKDSSCVSSNRALASCVAYAKCQLSGDPAPTNLPEICSMDALKTGDSTACTDACAAASCCYTDADDEKCHADKFLMCMDYAPCQNLRVNMAVPAAPSNLDEICEADDKTECQNACDAASCCIDDPMNGDNCFASDFITCASYASCGFLVMDIINNEVPQPPTETDICDPTLLTSEDGRDQCTNNCLAAECCTASGSDIMNNCFLSDPFGCLEYSSCAYLDATGGSVPVAPDSIKNVCKLQNILSSSDGRSDCDAICSAPEASCCFEWSYNETCATGDNAYACGTYWPCASLLLAFGGEGNLASPDESIKDKCTYDQVKENRTECENICEPAACCKSTSDDDNCFYENANVCAEYVFHCNTLFLPMGDVEAPEPPENINDVCGLLSFFGKSQECEDLCTGKPSCCTETMGDENCLVNSPEQCAKWLLYCS